MSALSDDAPPPGVPEWIVTYGDMMSLLLTFFIMLVSFSELKKPDQYHAVAETIMQKFGYDTSGAQTVPGRHKARNSNMTKMATTGRAKLKDSHKGGDDVEAATGDHPRVQIIRPGNNTGVGTVLFFGEFDVEITDAHRQALQEIVPVIDGKPQKIEVRAHTSQRPVTPEAGVADHWELAYRRAKTTMKQLVDEMKIDPRRIRLSLAGPNEPMHVGTDRELLRKNPRVEVFLLDEVVADLSGTEEERKAAVIDGGSS